jgi:hypothetical protein
MNLRAIAAADPDTPERQRNCGVLPVGSQVEIRLKEGSAYYCGVETCGNVWLCPVCSSKIHHRRADELRTALAIWEQAGHAASLVTITIPHNRDDTLSRLVGAERAVWKKVSAGAAWQRLKRRLGIVGYVMALEITWGDEHGWHPHYHVLLVQERDLDARAIAALHAHVYSRLAACCREFGLPEPDPLHGVRIDPNVSGTAAGAYVAKGSNWTPAEEMTRGDLKTGRSGSRNSAPDSRRLLHHRRHPRPRSLARVRPRHLRPGRRAMVARPAGNHARPNSRTRTHRRRTGCRGR